MCMSKNISLGLLALLASVMAAPASAQPQQKPNILVIMGDDIGYWNISAYNRGMMGYRTPNIDRIANEGAILTDYYGQQSCTAGRAAFITGQSPMRMRGCEQADSTPSGLHGRILPSSSGRRMTNEGDDGQGQRDDAAGREDCREWQPDQITQRSGSQCGNAVAELIECDQLPFDHGR